MRDSSMLPAKNYFVQLINFLLWQEKFVDVQQDSKASPKSRGSVNTAGLSVFVNLFDRKDIYISFLQRFFVCVFPLPVY